MHVYVFFVDVEEFLGLQDVNVTGSYRYGMAVIQPLPLAVLVYIYIIIPGLYIYTIDVYSLWDKTQISKIAAPPRGGSPEVTMKTPIYIKIADGCSSQHSHRKIVHYTCYTVYTLICVYLYIW